MATHASDQQQIARRFLAQKTETNPGDSILDICTGTGSVLLRHQDRVGKDGVVVGVDFSRGMLKVAKKKVTDHSKPLLVQADVAFLPLKEGRFHAVTCSHAFYELKGETARQCLGEVVRILKRGKRFLMMEHDVPKRLPIRILFYIRIFSMGFKKALEILKNEDALFKAYFGSVQKVRTETGRSKILIGKKTVPDRIGGIESRVV